MDTYIAQIDPEHPDPEIIRRAGDIIRTGGLVAFPTETVYGLGGDALSADSSAAIYAAKGRPSDNPLIVHISDISSLKRIATDIPEAAYELARVYWPGPLTMILHKSDAVPRATTGGLDTVAVRYPSDPVAQAFITAAGGYVAAPSANLSGKPSPTSGRYVIQDMDGRIDMILCGDDSRIGLESTIVDLTEDKPVILRPGYVTLDMLRRILPDTVIDTALIRDDSGEAPKAPGMKYRHYAPQGQLTIVEGEPGQVIPYINEQTHQDSAKGHRTGVIAPDDHLEKYTADVKLGTGVSGDSEAYAHRLFDVLRRMDDESVECIYAERPAGGGLDEAIMNRLLKAAGHHMVKI